MAYSAELSSELRPTLSTVLRYPDAGVLLGHSTEVSIQHEGALHPSAPSHCRESLTKGMKMLGCLVKFRSHPVAFSVFALQVKTAILGL